VIAGGAAMLGHWRPLFMGFARGGKAVATCGGTFLGIAPLIGGIGAAVWIVVFALFRYASLASITAAVSLPLAAVVLGELWPVIAFAALAASAWSCCTRRTSTACSPGPRRASASGVTPSRPVTVSDTEPPRATALACRESHTLAAEALRIRVCV
jgi:hypothetical protein